MCPLPIKWRYNWLQTNTKPWVTCFLIYCSVFLSWGASKQKWGFSSDGVSVCGGRSNHTSQLGITYVFVLNAVSLDKRGVLGGQTPLSWEVIRTCLVQSTKINQSWNTPRDTSLHTHSNVNPRGPSEQVFIQGPLPNPRIYSSVIQLWDLWAFP